MQYVRALIGLVFLALVGVGVLFWVQNSGRVTQLSLDLGIGAWQLDQPVAVPVLLAISFGCGFAAATLLMGMISMRQSSRMRRLEQELSVSSAISGGASSSSASSSSSSGSTEPGRW